MNYTGINWEGGLIGPETLENLNETSGLKGQNSSDFELDTPVRDEIQSCWADSVQQWKIFKTRIEREDSKDKYGTSRTRQFWIQPLLGFLGFDIESKAAEQIGEKSFAISHKATRRICPIHIVGYFESLDKAREGQKKSPHSMVQEYLNLNEEALFALVTNGKVIRLLRDSSHLVKLTYLEFDLEKIFEEELYDNFAVLYRLLHATRFPANGTEPSECLLESYHQNSLENGTRIRDKLSSAVKEAVRIWADGILQNPENASFVAEYEKNWNADDLNEEFLTLIYRLLFLLVIEERHLVYEKKADQTKRSLYYSYYSLQHLRKRCVNMGNEERHYHDAFEQLKFLFALFEDDSTGAPLGIKALAGDLFSKDGLKLLKSVYINNKDFADGFRLFDSYYDDERRVMVRVNYAALNVEEFGSIYEGLLAFDPCITKSVDGTYDFTYVEGTDRDDSSSHYTPEELVEPLIKSALEPLIQKKLQEENKEKALLSIRVCDDACGSGHILLNAARRIALELSRVRTQSDNPDPASYRNAEKDVIRSCIYGIDKNPQAVQLCKVALWLESHNPGTSLGFLDNHIKCGDSLVGVARVEELFDVIPSEAFKSYKDSDKEYYAKLKKNNDLQVKEKKAIEESKFLRQKKVESDVTDVIKKLSEVGQMPDTTPEQEEAKKKAYKELLSSNGWKKLKGIADTRLAGFFADKTQPQPLLIEYEYEKLFSENTSLEDILAVKYAAQVSQKKHFFHWFLEFAEVMAEGGFDCFLGNPPFKGNRRLKGTFGEDYLDYLKIAYAPAGAIDLVGYFVRRNYDLLKSECAMASLSTDTIAQGTCREGCLQVIENKKGTIIMAVRSTPWPGVASVQVSLLGIYKGPTDCNKFLDGKKVEYISTYFDTGKQTLTLPLIENSDNSFIGSYVLGQGFVISESAAKQLIEKDEKNRNVIMPYINGEEINSKFNQTPDRWIINFFERPLNISYAPNDYHGEFAEDYPDCLKIIEEKVKPERTRLKEDGTFALRKPLPQKWWQYADKRPALYKSFIERNLSVCLVTALTSKSNAFVFTTTNKVIDQNLVVFPLDNYYYLTILQSCFHFYWGWKFCSSLGTTFRYTSSTIFETFPFPAGFEPNRDYVPEAVKQQEDSSTEIQQHKKVLDELGQKLDDQRKKIMVKVKIGLTNLYNLYHQENLDSKAVIKTAKCSEEDAAWVINEIQIMRNIQVECDMAVAAAYGWNDIILNHGFYDLEFLPENDRRRYTVSPEARKEIMSRLLKLNNTRHQQELEAGFVDEDGKLIKKTEKKAKKQPSLFD
jgi:hypothetical protein